MTSVLLISDSEKVQRLFASLEKLGLFQLRTAATLIEGDQEISSSAPDVTFVQSRISGFSGLIMLRHLKKTLPKQATVLLLAGDADDAEQARQEAVPFLELALEDEALADRIRQVVEGAPRLARKKVAAAKQLDIGMAPVTVKKGAPAAAASTAPEKTKKEKPDAPQAPGIPAPGVKAPVKAPARKPAKESAREPGKGASKEPARAVRGPVKKLKEPVKAVKAVKAVKEPVEAVKEPVKAVKEHLASQGAVGHPGPDKKELPAAATTAEASAPEVAEPAAQKQAPVLVRPPEPPAPEREEPTVTSYPAPPTARQVSASFEEVMRRASGETGAAPATPPGVEDRIHISQPAPGPAAAPSRRASSDQDEAGGAPPEQVYQGESLADAMLRAQKKQRPEWILPLAVALVFIPLAVFFLVGKKETAPAPDGATAPIMTPGPTTAQRPAMAEGPALSPLSAAKAPEVKPDAGPGAEPARPVGEPAAKAAPQTGLKTLPPILQGLKVDPEYARTEPGWVRYIGATAEYKLFKEGDLYRAIQVIALAGGTVPDHLFKRVLFEFGGSDSYRVESTGKKGDYLLEHGTVNGQVGLTIYRRKEDLQIMGFVVYYR
jgi:CheY-like chemotaxis protein